MSNFEMFKVESSNVESVGWFNNDLYVKYQSGTTYKYNNVDRQVFLDLLGSKSRGKFMNENVKNKYSYSRV